MPSHDTFERESLLLRVLWMLLFFIVWQLAELLLLALALAQLTIRVLRGQPDASLQAFGGSLSRYLAQIGRYATFHTEEKPWPFTDWPATGDTQEGRP